MRISNFINGKGCPECSREKNRKAYALDISEVIRRVNEVGGELLNPNEYINNCTCNLVFKCQRCGDVFNSSLQHFLQHGGRVCYSCSHVESNGERRIREYLDSHNINYKQEHWFPNCRDIKPLPFDFYLPDKKTCIEFDGQQHYYNKGYFRHSVQQINSHDDIKDRYCKENGIKMIRIPYWEIGNISKILDDKIHTKI